jgi:predicted ATP-grasp superfamily ATP-dependent carboligase
MNLQVQLSKHEDTASRFDNDRCTGSFPARGYPSKVLLIGSFTRPLLAFARSADRLGVKPYLVEISRGLSQWTKYSSCLHGGTCLDPDLVGTEMGIRFLANYAKDLGASALICDNDCPPTWIAEHRSHFEPSTVVMVTSSQSMEALRSKAKQLELAKNAGFNTLPSWLLLRPQDFVTVPAEAYPVCLRPSLARKVRPQFKATVSSNPQELRTFLSGRTSLEGGIVVQPFLNVPNLLVHGVRSPSGQVVSLRSFLVDKKFEGIALSLTTIPMPPELPDACRRFVERADVTGCFHFDLLYSPSDRKIYFLEINERPGGTTDMVSKLTYDEFLYSLIAYGFEVRQTPRYRAPSTQRVANKRVLIKYILRALRLQLTALDYPISNTFTRITSSFRDLLFATDSVFDWRDLRGSCWYHCRVPGSDDRVL